MILILIKGIIIKEVIPKMKSSIVNAFNSTIPYSKEVFASNILKIYNKALKKVK